MFLFPPRPDDARVADLTRAFLDAEYRWQHDGQWRDILIGDPALDIARAFPRASTFGVLSAWNPMSLERGRTVNQQQDDLLRKMLSLGGHVHIPAFSSARNRTWREPGWLVLDMEADGFQVLARRFGQLGTLWWRVGEPVRMYMDASRPAGFGDAPFVHWLR